MGNYHGENESQLYSSRIYDAQQSKSECKTLRGKSQQTNEPNTEKNA
jgi:hypothetical protein